MGNKILKRKNRFDESKYQRLNFKLITMRHHILIVIVKCMCNCLFKRKTFVKSYVFI